MLPVTNPSSIPSSGKTSTVPAASRSQMLEKMEKALKTIKRYAITPTVLLPFSSRGIVINIVKTPFRLLQSLCYGIKEAAGQRSITALRTTFTEKMAGYMEKDWHGGISDVYTDLGSKENKDLGKQIARENMRYAGYIKEEGFKKDGSTGLDDKGFEKVDWEGYFVDSSTVNFIDNNQPLLNVLNGLKTLGFEEGEGKGIFYCIKTGLTLSVACDYTKEESPEIIVSLHGHYFGFPPGIDEEKQDKLYNEGDKGIVWDFIGGVPDSAIQMIELGKMLKETAKAGGYTPVVVGHSHGGALAQIAAAANGIKGVVFNSRPMGAGVRRYIGQDKIAENGINITVFSAKNDLLTRLKPINAIGIFMERVLGIPIPRSVGVGYLLPSVTPPGSWDLPYFVYQHEFFYDQLKSLLKEE